MNLVESRRDQMFPVFDAGQMETAKRFASDPARTFAVGDTPYDILAAHRVPVPAIAVRCGGFPEESLAKAEYVLDDLAQVTRELDRIDEYFRE